MALIIMAELPHADNARDLPPTRMAKVTHDDNARDLPAAGMVRSKKSGLGKVI
jgi:hypothetical protein